MTISQTDGRRARGEARRAQLIHAALAVIERDGLAGLTHRAVAEEAGVPLASAGYHFSGIDDLAMTAIAQATDDLVETLRAQPSDTSLTHLAQLLADEAENRPGLFIVGYELYLLAVRRPELVPEATAWLDTLADHFAPSLGGHERKALQATIEGVCIHALLHPERRAPDAIEATLRAAWPHRP